MLFLCSTLRSNIHSGVWNIPALPSSSLVGRPLPGRGDVGGLSCIGAGRPEGPSDARAADLGVPAPEPFGTGEGLGLVDGGRSDIVCVMQ